MDFVGTLKKMVSLLGFTVEFKKTKPGDQFTEIGEIIVEVIIPGAHLRMFGRGYTLKHARQVAARLMLRVLLLQYKSELDTVLASSAGDIAPVENPAVQ